jgi:methyltransferase (TIGR00027 family)
LIASGARLPESLHFVPADLSREDLGVALRPSAYRFDEPAIMSWLGVTMYLPREANFATFRSIAQFAAPGSELVFTYAEKLALESEAPTMQRAKAIAAAMGEPWICGFDSQTLGDELREVGLELIESLGRDELRAQYCANRTDGLSPGVAGRFALARVDQRAAAM